MLITFKYLKGKYSNKYSFIILLLLIIQAPSLRVLDKYLPTLMPLQPILLLAVIIAVWVALIYMLKSKVAIVHILNLPYLFIAIMGLLAVVCYFVYPIADGLKDVGRGSDQDDAIILSALALFSGTNPYQFFTYYNNPISPGPGWVMFCAPFVYLGLYSLITPISITATGLVMRWYGKTWIEINLFVGILLSSVVIWELAIVGSDLIAYAMVLYMFVLTLKKTNSIGLTVLLAILLGAFSTGRIVFAYLPLLFAFSLWQQSISKSLLVGLIGTLICVILHGYFYNLSGDFYPPLHLLEKGRGIFPIALRVTMLGVCGITGIIMLWKRNKLMPEVLILLGILPPLIIVAFGDLMVIRNFNLAAWEGANYLIPTIGLVTALTANLAQEILKRPLNSTLYKM